MSTVFVFDHYHKPTYEKFLEDAKDELDETIRKYIFRIIFIVVTLQPNIYPYLYADSAARTASSTLSRNISYQSVSKSKAGIFIEAITTIEDNYLLHIDRKPYA